MQWEFGWNKGISKLCYCMAAGEYAQNNWLINVATHFIGLERAEHCDHRPQQLCQGLSTAHAPTPHTRLYRSIECGPGSLFAPNKCDIDNWKMRYAKVSSCHTHTLSIREPTIDAQRAETSSFTFAFTNEEEKSKFISGKVALMRQ